VKSQTNKLIYYDSDWKVISDKSNASYFRKIEDQPNNPKHFLVKDFYITGEVQMEAEMTSIDPEIMDGDVKFFFKNGKQHTSRKYRDGKEDGYYKEWYENDKLEKEGLMENDELNGEWKYYYANGKLRTTGSYIAGSTSGIWKTYNLDGEYYLQQNYKDNQLIGIKLIDNSKGLYEYYTEIDSIGKINIIPFIGYDTDKEYKLVEPLIKDNINFLQKCTDFNTFQINYPYTMIWLTNCPYMGKFEINATKFMVEYTTEIEKSYKYSSFMTKMYILGLGAYLLENNGKINDLNKFHETGALFLINYYLSLKKIDSKEKSKKIEMLAELNSRGKLLDYIKKY